MHAGESFEVLHVYIMVMKLKGNRRNLVFNVPFSDNTVLFLQLISDLV